MNYEQKGTTKGKPNDSEHNMQRHKSSNPHVLQLPDLAPGFILEDQMLKDVRDAYQKIMGDEGAPFMVFEDREGQGNGEDGGDEGID